MGCVIKYKGQSIPEEQFLQYLNKQIAINNLFNENENLANEVYKALGFKSKPNVILPIGTSGSGKSTFIKSLPQENLVVIEPDAMRVEFTGDINDKSKDKEIYEEAANRAIAAIKQGKQVVFDTTNLTKDKRLPFIEAIKKAIPTANIQYKLMELNPELAKQRIKADIAAGKNRANVPDATIDRHAESYKQMLEDIKSEPISNFEITPQQKQDAQRIYSRYLESLNKPNTNPILQGNQNITQDDKSYYRGQIEQPTIDKNGNLVLYAREDELYKKTGLKSKGVSMTDDLQSAIEYGNGQLDVSKNLASEENIGVDLERELDRLDENGYYLIQIPKNISDEIVKEAGEVKVIGDKIVIPKGQYKIEQVIDGVKNQITLQQEQLKKFAELQERLSNKAFLEGAKNVFESSEELQNEVYKALGFGNQKDTVRLYRIENKNIPYDESREGIVSKKEIIGGFFTDNVDTVANYIRKNQFQEGINLVYVDISKSDLDKYHVSKNEYAKNMDVESDNWIVPSNINKNYIDLSGVSKVTGNFMALSKARQELKDIVNNLPTSEITPQQKQQALDIYTDYIARVSLGIIKNPTSGEYNYTSKVKDININNQQNTREQILQELITQMNFPIVSNQFINKFNGIKNINNAFIIYNAAPFNNRIKSNESLLTKSNDAILKSNVQTDFTTNKIINPLNPFIEEEYLSLYNNKKRDVDYIKFKKEVLKLTDYLINLGEDAESIIQRINCL